MQEKELFLIFSVVFVIIGFTCTFVSLRIKIKKDIEPLSTSWGYAFISLVVVYLALVLNRIL